MSGAALRAAVLVPQAEPKDLLTSVERALTVLEVIAASPEPMPAKAVAQRLEISLGTSYRVLHTLEHTGYLVRLGHGCFGLTGKIAQLSRRFQARLDVLPTTRPALEELAAEAREDVYLAVFRAGEIAIADVVEGSAAVHLDGIEVGFSQLAHTTAVGKVLLAASPGDVVDDFLSEARLRAYTARSLVRRGEIKRHLRKIRGDGLGYDLEEVATGCCCVAAGIRDGAGTVVGSVGLSTSAERWRDEHARLTWLCSEAAAGASRALAGGSGS